MPVMRVVIFGATGRIGSRIAAEAHNRGHSLTAVARRPPAELELPEYFTVVKGDVTDPSSVARAVAGQDAVISAVSGIDDGSPETVVTAAHALIGGMTEAGVERLLIVGGAGSLETESGVELVDTPSFPKDWKPGSEAQRRALAVYRNEADGLIWSYLSPADVIEPGERTGRFELGGDRLVVDSEGRSRISIEDYAVALVDELEQSRFPRARFTVGYA